MKAGIWMLRGWPLRAFGREFRFFLPWDFEQWTRSTAEPSSCVSRWDAAAAIRQSADEASISGDDVLEALFLAVTRRGDVPGCPSSARRELVVSELLEAVAARRLVAVESQWSAPPSPADVEEVKPPEPQEPAGPPAKFELRVVLDADGTPVSQLMLGAKSPGEASFRDVRTDRDGRLVIEHVPRKPFEVGSTLRGARLDACATVVGWGPAPASSQGAPRRSREGDELPIRHLVELDEYRVRDGDTPASVAARANLSWEDVAYFNWGTREPREIDRALRFGVGCRARAADGTPTFSAKDLPGIIRIPRPFAKSDLAVDMEHVVRVRRPTGLDQEFILFLHNGEAVRDRRFSLHFEDGSEVTGAADAEGRTGLKASDIHGSYRVRLLGPRAPSDAQR